MTTFLADLHDESGRIVLHSIDEATGRLVSTPWAKKPLMQQIPGKAWDKDLKRWTFPLSWAVCVQLRAIFGSDLQVGTQLGVWARAKRTQRQYSMALRDMREFVESSPYKNEHDNILYPFQIPGRDFLVTAKNALLGDEMGSGKTLQTLAALRAVDGYPALIVCPNSVKRNWANEVGKWLPEATPIVVAGSAAKRRKILADAHGVDNAVIIMNIESIRLHSRLAAYGSVRLKRCIECDPKHGDAELKISRCEVHNKELNGFDFKVCVLDEAHRVKDPRALQTRAIWHVFHSLSVDYRWALTGTPVANHPGDLWSILHTIDPDEFPRKSAFIDRYALAEFNAFGGMDIMGLNPDTKEEFFSLIDPMFRRMLKSQVLTQLPEKAYITREVEMSPKQRTVYESMDDSAIAILDDDTKLVADGNLAAATRLLQFASAYCEIDTDHPGHDLEDPKTWKVTLADPSPKIDELMAIIKDDPDKPLAIAAEHRQLLDLAAKRLQSEGIEFGRITGGVSEVERAKTVDAFQDGKLKYVLFTYKAGGVGINLTRADTLVRLQRSWSMIDNAQGVDRVHRIGSEIHESINIIDVITAGTIEERQLEKLYEKAERAEEVMRDRQQTQQAEELLDVVGVYESHAEYLRDLERE
jgi:SNF2 family DNA or RNA helicase